MYLSHYDLNAYPFQMSTDPKFLWLGEKHKEALATLKYAIFENKGVIALTGDVGTGKTTLINALIEDLGDDIVVTTIYDPGLEMLEFFNIVAVAFSMGVTFTNKGQFLIHFRQFLQKAREQKKKVLLIIDEAQRIGPELLEEVRLLSNLEAEHIRLLNIFFIGQNEFVDILQEDVNRALRQRIAINYEIQPLTVKETESYVKHRLRIAGAKTSIFTQVSIQEIYAFSSGYPRLINIICDHALLSGFVNGVKSIDSDIIRECRKELQISEWSSVQDRRIAEKSMGEEHTQKHNLGPSEDQDDENGSVRLARGLYRQAPVTRPDKKPVVLSILSVVVLFLLAVVVGYYYYHSSQVKVKPLNNISPQKNRAFDSRPSDLKDENQYIVPFIPEAGEKGTSETAEDVTAPSDLKAELAKERSFKEITPNDVQKPVVALSDKRAEDTGINITPDGKWDPWKHSQIQDSNAVRQSEPPNEKNTAPKIVAGSGAANKQEKKQIQREKVVEKEAVKSKKKATKPPVTPKDKASKKKVLAKEKKLTAHVDQKAGLQTTPNIGAKTIGKQKLLQESLEPRLKTFLADYSRAYENRKIDQFIAFFAPDGIDDGKPFNQQLPKYRRNFERLDALDYRIKMNKYSIQKETGFISIDGTYYAKVQLAGGDGEWKQSSGRISMAIEAYKDTFRIKRLRSTDRSALQAATASGDNLLDRLNAFLKEYSSVYENKQIDEFATLFTPDATEKGEPFHSLLPKYRRNFEKIDSMDYRIELKRYSVLEGSELIRIEGVANLRAKLTRDNRVWRETSTGIFMELEDTGDSFRVRRLDY